MSPLWYDSTLQSPGSRISCLEMKFFILEWLGHCGGEGARLMGLGEGDTHKCKAIK